MTWNPGAFWKISIDDYRVFTGMKPQQIDLIDLFVNDQQHENNTAAKTHLTYLKLEYTNMLKKETPGVCSFPEFSTVFHLNAKKLEV